MLISSAFAQTAGAAPAAGGFDPGLLAFPLIIVVFYFLLIRPQQKRMKQHQEMVKNIRRGDKVVVGGGILGTISKVVSDTEVQVEIAENVRVRVVRSAISEIVSKTEPVAAEGEAPAATESKPAADGKASALGKLLGKDK